MGIVALYEGNARAAHRLLDESLRLCLELNVKGFLKRIYVHLAETALWEGELDQAEQWLRQSLVYRVGPTMITTHTVGQIFVTARLATAQQQYLRAATLFGLANQMHSQVHDAIGGPMRSLADAALATVRATLEPAVFAEAFAAGQRLSLDAAFTTGFFQ